MMQAQTARDMSNYMQGADAYNRQRLSALDAQNSQVVNAQLQSMTSANNRANDQWNWYVQNGRPMLQNAMNDANNFDSASALAGLRGQAAADVEQAFAQQNAANQRGLQRMGVNPSSGRAQAALAAGGAQAALGKVGAANAMTEARRTQAVGLRQQAANLASGMPAQSMGFSGVGNQAGMGAASVGQMGMQSALGMQSNMISGYGGVANAYGGAANTYNGIYQGQLQAANLQNQADAGVGSLIGTLGAAAIFASDFRMKQNIVPVGKLSNGLTLYSFQYKPEYHCDFGDDTFFGVMAQEVLAVRPDAVIVRPDGFLSVDYSRVM
jgi:hypothetical protein